MIDEDDEREHSFTDARFMNKVASNEAWQQKMATSRAAYEAEAVAKAVAICHSDTTLMQLRGEFRSRSDRGMLNFHFAESFVEMPYKFFVGDKFAFPSAPAAEVLGTMKKSPWPLMITQLFREAKDRDLSVARVVSVFRFGSLKFGALTADIHNVDKCLRFPGRDGRPLMLCTLDTLLLAAK